MLSSRRTNPPVTMYAPPKTPADSASTSPTNASPDTATSTPVTSSTPLRHTAVPTHARRGSRSPSSRPSRPAHTACEQTSAVEDATDVYSRLGMNVPKCAASAAPASSASHSDRADARPTRRRASANGASMTAAAPVRQNAIASAGAAVAAISGGAVDAHSTPIASSA